MIKNLEQKLSLERATMITILVATLGYFVDVFDLLLFSIVRVASLKDLGIAEDKLLDVGILLINTQMAGLLIGGVLWGVWGDRMGRISVLFGSILLYSLANIANGFVETVPQYAILRFIAGIGLAGELGAGITLASELLPKQWRGLGSTFIATIGVLGAVFAAVIAELTDWRTAYIIGGLMGLALLVLRMNVRESALFEAMGKKEQNIKRGNPLMLLRPDLLKKYVAVILVGAPLWGILALFITFTPEFAKDFGMTDIPKAGGAVLFCYIGISLGDVLSGLLSQLLQSRRKAIMAFQGLTMLFVLLYIYGPHHSIEAYYGLCLMLGIGCGYWVMFVQSGAEQFGTNLRSTAATSIPNIVRATVIPATASFHALIPLLGVTGAGVTIVSILLFMGFLAILWLEETFDTDLDYIEK
jgi:MFS transporter, putative metabolite:H+ symporter